MPRKSLENRVIVAPRVAPEQGHPPPRGMTPAAKGLWRRIVKSKPHDRFDAGSLVLLRQCCEIAVEADLRVARRRGMDRSALADGPRDPAVDQQAEALERRISA